MAKLNIEPKQIGYYLTVTKVDVIETELKGKMQILEVPDVTYKRALYLDVNVPREIAEQEIVNQLYIIFKKMSKKE